MPTFFFWLLAGLLLTFAMVVLLVDHALYPGVPGTDAGATPPAYMVTLRDVAFFILTISCMLFVLFLLASLRSEGNTQTLGNRAGQVFVALNGAFFIASLVYVFVYRYELSASAQAGSTASNFYYAAVTDLGLVMLLLAGTSCYKSPGACFDVIRGVFQVLAILGGGPVR